ncbi:MAG: luxQ [Gammaproteobacteria bacterium]|jgi:PAS domain S-box-containing protein|nr:luxQ [Gammaproteobacteria bacterium]
MSTVNVNIEGVLSKLIIAAFNSTSLFFWLKSLSSNKYLYVNSALTQIYGIPYEDILKKTELWCNLLNPEESVLLQNNYKKVINKQIAKGTHKFKILTVDNTVCWLEEEFFTLQEEGQAEVYLVGIAKDITAIMNYQEELHETSIYFAKLAEKSEDVFWVKSSDYSQQLYVSPSFETIWGRSVKELYCHPERWDDYLYPEDSKKLGEKISDERNVYTDPEVKFYENYRIVRPDGELRYIADCSFPIFSRKNELIGFAGIARDVTERVLYEQALKEAKDQAEAANKSKTEFLTNMSHDLRTPFSGILSMTSFLYEHEQDPTKKEMQDMVLTSAKRLLALLTDVLELSSLGSRPVRYTEFNIKDVVNEVSDLISAEIKMKHLKVMVDCPSTIITTDKHRVTRILLNLAGNAIKFTEKGCITIKVTTSPCLKLIVQDTGIGIPQDKLETIFEKFKKLLPSNQHANYQGTGLGLYIVKQFTEELAGTVTVSSQLNQGSCFTVKLPLIHAMIS